MSSFIDILSEPREGHCPWHGALGFLPQPGGRNGPVDDHPQSDRRRNCGPEGREAALHAGRTAAAGFDPLDIGAGILAPLQFLVFLVSLALVLRYLVTGAGYEAATLSIILKTLVLYLIMVTGSLWEHAVFGKYLLAPAFFWEDM